MSTLVAIAYPDQNRASEVLSTLQQLQKEYLIDVDDAAYITRDVNGKMRLHQSHNLTGAGAVWGGFWGLLVGSLFLMPVVGLAIGAATGGLSGHFSEYGIDDNFIKSLSADMEPNSSALFVLVRRSTPDKVLPEIQRFGGHILQTNLSAEAEGRLRQALNSNPVTPDMSTQTNTNTSTNP